VEIATFGVIGWDGPWVKVMSGMDETKPGAWDEASLPRPSRDLEVLERDLRGQGYCLIEAALEPSLLQAVQRRLSEQAAAERALHDSKNPANPQEKNQWVGMLLNKGEVFFDLVRHPIAMALIDDLLGADYLISCVDAQIQHPGSTAMALHTDQWWMPPPIAPQAEPRPVSTLRRGAGGSTDPSPAKGPISAAMVANAMWMIDDFTEENGATRLVPGSHLSGRMPDPAVPHGVATVAATGPAGTAFVFDGRLWHGAGANNSDKPRRGITTNCCGPQCRPLENYTRGLRPEVLARCPPEILARLGFAAWSSYGHTGDPATRLSEPGEQALGELKPEA
jgi:ectoine hydroxylase-related dioxygenase (phytanoyl-CoA dioxygenase family)